MPAKKDDAATTEVVAVVPLHHGTREFPKVLLSGQRGKLELDPDSATNAKMVKELIDSGKALKPKDVPEDADIAEIVAAANTVGSVKP